MSQRRYCGPRQPRPTLNGHAQRSTAMPNAQRPQLHIRALVHTCPKTLTGALAFWAQRDKPIEREQAGSGTMVRWSGGKRRRRGPRCSARHALLRHARRRRPLRRHTCRRHHRPSRCGCRILGSSVRRSGGSTASWTVRAVRFVLDTLKPCCAVTCPEVAMAYTVMAYVRMACAVMA